MMTLATFYPQYTFWFQISMAIDITCHWLYLHTVTLQGKASHKFIDMSENPVMRIYYTNKMVLFFMCAGNEAFYAALYVMYFYTGPTGDIITNKFSTASKYTVTRKIKMTVSDFSPGCWPVQVNRNHLSTSSYSEGRYISPARCCWSHQPLYY